MTSLLVTAASAGWRQRPSRTAAATRHTDGGPGAGHGRRGSPHTRSTPSPNSTDFPATADVGDQRSEPIPVTVEVAGRGGRGPPKS
jgi:hypothetical protein